MPGPVPMPPIGMPPIGMPPVVMPPAPPGPGAVPPPPVPPPPPGPGPVPALPIESTHKTANDACIRRLRQLKVTPNPKIYPSPGDPGIVGFNYPVQTNVFGVEVGKTTEVYQYVVHIKADLSNTKEAVFTKKGKDDFIVLDRHQKCCDIFYHATELFYEFFQIPKNQLIYDGQSMLFTTMDLFPGEKELFKKTKLMEINGAKVNNQDLHTLSCIKVEVYAGKNPTLMFSQEAMARRTADANIDANNRAFNQLLELVLNQRCVRDTDRFAIFEHGKIYFVDPNTEGYEQGDCADVGDGKYMMPGIKKSIQFIEGPFGRGQNNPAMVIDAKKAAFHREQLVLNKIGEILLKAPNVIMTDSDRQRCAAIIRGLDCHSTYTGRVRHLKIEGIHQANAVNSIFQLKDGSRISVLDYLKNKYNVTLRYPNFNLIVCKERGNTNFYPMELMTITKSQRVTVPQLTSVQSQKTTRESAVPPMVRQRLIMTGKTSLQICEGNTLLDALGVTICPEPILAPGRCFPGMGVLIGEKKLARTDLGKWRLPLSGKYLRCAEGPAVWAMYAVGSSSMRFTQQDLEKFAIEFMNMFNSKGGQLRQPSDCKLVSTDHIEQALFVAAEAKCKFCFIITEDSITHLHNKYKVIERDTEMIVQDMTMSKASSVIYKGRRQTLENVINKTNIKLGGLNYLINHPIQHMTDQLIVGIGISAPPPGNKFVMEGKHILNPTVIGYASNARAEQEFTGDFVLNTIGQDTLAPVEDVLKATLEQYQRIRGKLPKTVIVYRSGASEGAHGPILAYEIPLARNALEEYGKNIKLEYIVVTKDHNYRFFKNVPKDEPTGSKNPDEKSKQETPRNNEPPVVDTRDPNRPPRPHPREKTMDINLPSGIVIDKNVTHPASKQFFLNSHTTLQGTAKTPLYTVLADDCNASLDMLEELTYTLCHDHQIVNLATSLPTPLYVAIEYAKRGRNLFAERVAKVGSERVGDGENSERERLKEITNEIGYKRTGSLFDRRINA